MTDCICGISVVISRPIDLPMLHMNANPYHALVFIIIHFFFFMLCLLVCLSFRFHAIQICICMRNFERNRLLYSSFEYFCCVFSGLCSVYTMQLFIVFVSRSFEYILCSAAFQSVSTDTIIIMQ